MSEPRIGRVLVASLHQSIADNLPTRLEFYENWLSVTGLREGTIGLAPLSAVLSFLRSEGEAYPVIAARAGEYAADWTVRGLPAMERRLIAALPLSLRARAARGVPDERPFLAPLWDSVGRGLVQADDLLAAYEGEWKGDLSRIYEACQL